MSPYRDAPREAPTLPRVRAAWVPREVPLAVRGVAAHAAVAHALWMRLMACDDRALARWRGVAAGADLVLLGDELPWVDGAVWLGRDGDAPAWLLPTALRPSLPCALLVRAVPGAAPAVPHAAWPVRGALRVVPLLDARPLSRARLASRAESLP